ncbi:ribosomal protein S18 acetylase RimI-like enzyme [Tenggerimyces flavus]|nr:ribosomal protein S18 acetylase RimI-like enzyme [Tenggerimyces flavus]
MRDARLTEHDDIGDLLVEVYGGGKLVAPSYLEWVADSAGRAGAAGLETLVAFLPGSTKILGTVALAHPDGGFHYSTSKNEAQLRLLATRPEARGHGIGTALVAECVARTRLAGYTGLSLDTMLTMPEAQRLYSRLGFDRAPERDEIARSGDPMLAYVRHLHPWPLVRPAEPDEYEEIGELTVGAYLRDELQQPDSPYLDRLRATKSRALEARLLVAADRTSGEILGTATYCPTGSPWCEISQPDEGEFRMLAVSPAAGVKVWARPSFARASRRRSPRASTAWCCRAVRRWHPRTGSTNASASAVRRTATGSRYPASLSSRSAARCELP